MATCALPWHNLHALCATGTGTTGAPGLGGCPLSGGCLPRRHCWQPAQDERCVGCVPPCRRQVRGCPLQCPTVASGTPRDAGWALLLLPSLKAHLSAFPPGFKCPICSKSVASDEMEMHFIMCLSKPRLSYNGKGRRPGFAGGHGVLPTWDGSGQAGETLAAGGLVGLAKRAVLQRTGAARGPCSAPLGLAAFAFRTLCNAAPSLCCSPRCAVPEAAILARAEGTCVLLGCPPEGSLPSSPPCWQQGLPG